MTTDKLKKYVLPKLPYVIVFWFANKLGMAYRLAEGSDFLKRLTGSMATLNTALAKPFPSFLAFDLLIGVAGAAIIYAVVYFRGKNAKKYRKGVEHGSARFGTAEDIKPYIDQKSFANNILLSQSERLTMGKPSAPKYARNKNVLVVGGSGSGKTRFFVKPNLMQCTSKAHPISFCVSDPKGTVLLECGKMLKDNGYDIKVINTINFSKSMHYNREATRCSQTNFTWG